MATSVTFNGTSYSIPGNREPRGWGTSLSAFLVDVANSSLSKAGGNFTLTADSNFGANYGLVVKYIKSVSSNIAASGVVRLANTDKIAFRNNANSADLELGVSTSDRLQFDSVNVPTVSSTDTFTNKTLTSPVINTPTGIVKGDVGLGNVDNTSDASKPVSTAQQTALDLKANSASPTLVTPTIDGYLDINEESAPGTPAANTVRIYTKADAKIYKKDDAGVETQLATTAEALSNPMTTAGDIIYGGGSGAATRLAGNTTTTRKVLAQTGDGANSAAPAWSDDLATASSNGRVAPRKGETLLTVTSTVAGWSTTRAVGIYYQDQDGAHRLKFNIAGSVTSNTYSGGTWSISGVTFKNVASYRQAVTATANSITSAASAFVSPNSDDIEVTHPSTASTAGYYLSGDVELDSKPSWA